MTVITCPACKSDLTESGKYHDVECISCGNEFDIQDAKVKDVSMTQLFERLKSITGGEICQNIYKN
jgi:uncharacterized Zn finger protein (UPF0148 family)